MNKNLTTSYQEIRNQILGILSKDGPLWKKVLLITGLCATGAALVMLVIHAIYWLILFLAGVSILSLALRRSS